MKLSILFEADMSRRDFLGFLGKAGAAAYGAPLGKLSELGKLVKPEKLINKIAYVNLYPNLPSLSTRNSNLSDDLSILITAWNNIKKLTGDADIGIMDIAPYGDFHFTAKIKGQDPAHLIKRWGFKALSNDYESMTGQAWNDECSLDMRYRSAYKQLTAGKITDLGIFEITDQNDFQLQKQLSALSKAIELPHGRFSADSIEKTIKVFTEKIVKYALDAHEGFLSKEYFDKEGLKVLENNGVNISELVKEYDEARKENEDYEDRTRRQEAMRGKKLCASCDKPVDTIWVNTSQGFRSNKLCQHCRDGFSLTKDDLSIRSGQPKQAGKRHFSKGKFRATPGTLATQPERAELEAQLWDESFERRLQLLLK